MPIHSYDENQIYPVTDVEKIEKQQPRVASTSYKSAIVESKFTPLADILTTVEGSPWLVNYFSRVMGADEAPENFDHDLPSVYHQYLMVNNLIIKVASPLEYTQQEDTNDPLLQGEAMVYRSVIPNAGDVFLADVGDGKEGIFQITFTERKSLFKEAVFVIRYVFMGYSQEGPGIGWLNTLLGRVVKTTYYNDDYTGRTDGPLLSGTEVNLLKSLEVSRAWLIDQFCSQFYSQQFNTFLVPSLDSIYDPYVVNTITAIVSSKESAEMRKISPYRTDGMGGVEGKTVWDVIMNNNYGLRTMIHPKVWKISSRAYAINLALGGIAFSGIGSVVTPKGRLPGILQAVESGGESMYTPEPITAGPSRTLMYPVIQDDYYVFSEAFYTDNELTMSEMELAVKKYTSDLPYDSSKIKLMCDEIKHRPLLDQFYYIPVLIALTHWSIRHI